MCPAVKLQSAMDIRVIRAVRVVTAWAVQVRFIAIAFLRLSWLGMQW
jgi:hypothetical protein